MLDIIPTAISYLVDSYDTLTPAKSKNFTDYSTLAFDILSTHTLLPHLPQDTFFLPKLLNTPNKTHDRVVKPPMDEQCVIWKVYNKGDRERQSMLKTTVLFPFFWRVSKVFKLYIFHFIKHYIFRELFIEVVDHLGIPWVV